MAFAAKRLLQLGQSAVLLLVVAGTFSRSAVAAEQPYTFIQEGPRYTFIFTFVVDASPDQVLVEHEHKLPPRH